MTTAKLESAAIVTIRDAAEMTAEGRKAIADWLRMHAKMLLQHGGDYSKVFRGRYLYEAGAPPKARKKAKAVTKVLGKEPR